MGSRQSQEIDSEEQVQAVKSFEIASVKYADSAGDALNKLVQPVQQLHSGTSALADSNLFNPNDTTAPIPKSMGELKEKYPTEVALVLKKLENEQNQSSDRITERLNSTINVPYLYKKLFSRGGLRDHKGILNNELKMKFLISDIDSWSKMPYFLRFVVGLTPLKPPCGFVHTALQIGPWVFHWFDNSLVLVDEGAKNVSIAIDLDGSLHLEKDVDIIKKFLGKVVEWNTKREYSMTKNHCQSFIMEALEAMGRTQLACKFSGSIAEYFERIDSTGIKQKIFKCPYEKNEVIFETHEQLDCFVRSYLKTFARHNGLDPNTHEKQLMQKFIDKHPQEYALLKSYDRGWWLKTVKFARNNRQPPNDKHKAKNCPFDDPTQTGSFPIK